MRCGKLDHVLLTHFHLDHIAALPLMVDAIAAYRKEPLAVHALAGTIAALQMHIFNNVIWPDFTRIPTPQAPFIQLHEFKVGETLKLANKSVEVLSAVHTVPSCGFAVNAGGASWVFTGDTEKNPQLWRRLNQLEVGNACH